MSDDSERNLDASDQRKEQFRKDGKFARAKDAGGIAATVAVMGVLSGSSASMGSAMRELFARTLGDLGALERLGPNAALSPSARTFASLAGAPIAAAAVAATVAGLAQAGFKIYPEMLEVKLERLNPMGAISKMFSPKRAGGETAVSVLRVAAVAWASWHAIMLEVPGLMNLSRMPLEEAMAASSAALGRVFAVAIGALVLVALIDYGQSWLSNSREMKMTHKEQKEEHKQSEGDAKSKAKMKAKGRALAKKRAMNSVKNADVIVTNPTHYAVALRYGPKDAAPVLLAKGTDDVAMTIRGEARKHGIPILENRALARALYAEVQPGRPIPAAHFAAVARVLAFVFRLRGKSGKNARGIGRGPARGTSRA